MAKLDLQFIEQKNVPWGGYGFLALALVAGVWVTLSWIDLNRTYVQNLDRATRLEVAIKDKVHIAKRKMEENGPASDLRIKDEAAISNALNYSWNRVFSTVEQAYGDDVAILSFKHEQSENSTQLSVEAMNVPALIHYVDKMNEFNEGKRWYIANYQMQSEKIPPTVKASILQK